MNNKPYLCYAMQRKREKIIEYKGKLTRFLRYLYIGYFALGLILLSLVFNSEHFTMNLAFSNKLFPNLQRTDFLLLYLGLAIGAFLFVVSGKHGRMKIKYELLRHDIIKDLDSTILAKKICLCKDDCDCRELFIKEMDQLDIDIIFKKYKPEGKYML